MKPKFTLSLLLLNLTSHFSITEKYLHPNLFPAITELMEQNASIQVVSESRISINRQT